MSEFFHFIFSGSNAIATALLLFVLLYWITVILGFLGTDFLDFDIEIDADIDADAEVDLSGDSSADISWINNVLIFFNLGKIPLMIWLSFLVFPLWLMVVNVNGLLGISNFLLGLLVFFPAFIVSLFIAKVLTWPFVKFFSKIDEDSKQKDITGKIGTVILSANHESKGQAEVNYNGTFLRFNIKTKKGITVNKGEQVLFIEKLNDEEAYLIEPYQTIQ